MLIRRCSSCDKTLVRWMLALFSAGASVVCGKLNFPLSCAEPVGQGEGTGQEPRLLRLKNIRANLSLGNSTFVTDYLYCDASTCPDRNHHHHTTTITVIEQGNRASEGRVVRWYKRRLLIAHFLILLFARAKSQHITFLLSSSTIIPNHIPMLCASGTWLIISYGTADRTYSV